MCPSVTPPGFFDFFAPHTSLLVWGWWLVPPLFILAQVWGYRRFLSRLPARPERHAIARRFVIGGSFCSVWIALSALMLLWADTQQRWYFSLPDACHSNPTLQEASSHQSILQAMLYVGAILLGFVGLFILLYAFKRYLRARQAPRLTL